MPLNHSLNLSVTYEAFRIWDCYIFDENRKENIKPTITVFIWVSKGDWFCINYATGLTIYPRQCLQMAKASEAEQATETNNSNWT